jgi:5'-3' exonuclease
MSGCDYLPGMERMGLKTGIKNFNKHKNLKGLISFLRNHKKFKDRIPKQYFESVMKVHDLFMYQTVYCPTTMTCRPLNTLDEGKEIDQNFCGKYVPEEHLPKYVKGGMNKYTMEEREIYDVDVKRIETDMKGNDVTHGTFYYLNEKYDLTNKRTEDSDEEDKLDHSTKGK